MSRWLVTIRNDADRTRAAHWARHAKDGMRIEFKAATRSLEQNNLFWALLTDVAVHMKPLGRDYTTEEWKLLFLQAWGQEVRFIPALDGKSVVPVGQSSSDLSKDEMTSLIEWIYAWGAENGVVFNDPQERAA